jgi:hypothetical protein
MLIPHAGRSICLVQVVVRKADSYPALRDRNDSVKSSRLEKKIATSGTRSWAARSSTKPARGDKVSQGWYDVRQRRLDVSIAMVWLATLIDSHLDA